MSEQCKHCGSSNWEYGTITRGWAWPQYFQGKFGKRRKLAAVLCLTCGHVELILDIKIPFSTAAVDHPSLRSEK
jgi:hypothetical protein